MRQFFILYFFLVVLILTVFGFRGCTSTKPPIEIFPDMDRQAKFHEQGSSGFFGDGRMNRPPVPGTVPHVTEDQAAFPHLVPYNRFREDDYLATGLQADGSFGDGIPVDISYEAMKAGQDLFEIYCTICHGSTGNGKGVVAQERYGYNTIISLLQDRIADQPDGEIFNTITYGKNTMGPYGKKMRVEDRWKVVMYVRALQRAAAGTVDDVPADEKGGLGL